ncbi:MAG: hypothetical protein AAGH38_06015, partial [Pseudomonadota bacterium]
MQNYLPDALFLLLTLPIDQLPAAAHWAALTPSFGFDSTMRVGSQPPDVEPPGVEAPGVEAPGVEATSDLRCIADLEIVNALIEPIVIVVSQQVIEVASVLHLIEQAVLVAILKNSIKAAITGSHRQ